MNVTIRATGGTLGRASELLLSNNIEAYENTIRAGAILQPVAEFEPEFAGANVALPPASLVRVQMA